jgi:hypothetical protein
MTMPRVKTFAAFAIAASLPFAWACSPAPTPGSDADLPDGTPEEPIGSESCDELGLVDWDGDGISDEMEGSGDPDDDGRPNRLDTDSDGDGLGDEVEAGRRDCDAPTFDSDEDGTPDYLDLDSDGNGIPDAEEGDDDTDSNSIPNWRDRDDDGDGIPDAVELGPDPMNDPPDSDGDGVLDYHDTDSDGDEIHDGVEGMDDTDGDGFPDYRDLDADGDGILDEIEGTGDCDGDGLGSWVDTDSNGDGIPDWEPGEVTDSACPACTPACEASGPVEPDAADDSASGVVPNPDGPGIVIGSESTDAGYAWVANSEDPWGAGGGTGTVTKLDLDTGEEVGRFLVGLPGQSNSPSRTAVDGNGDAYIACRAFGQQGTVIKIAANLEDCVDRNRNGRIDTSSGSTPLPYGEDECILWTAEVGRSGGTPRALAVDLGGLDSSAGLPWVGLHEENRMVQLDPDDGSVLAEVATSVNPYGAAIDSLGSIWISGFMNSAIQRIDSVTYEADPSVSIGGSCSSGPYGIATDNRDRVWIGSFSNGACRYDPFDGSWFGVTFGGAGWNMSRGVAVDAFDVVWVAAHGESAPGGGDGWFYSFNADDGSDVRGIPTGGSTPVGVAVDSLGFIWAINQSSNTASRLDPSTEEVQQFPVGMGPYTYSDFTGFQRARVFSNGEWSTDFEACPDRREGTEVEWQRLVWEANAPGSTTIELYGQTANTEATLAGAERVLIATVPGSTSPADIEDAFDRAGVTMGWFLRITAVLRSSGGSQSPVFESVEVSWECDDGPLG